MRDLYIVPVSLKVAKAFVRAHHRHHDIPGAGHRFAIGVARDAVLCGVAIIGNPVNRVLAAEGYTLEVNRTATDGTPNANSMLYGAGWRAAKSLGWNRLITYNEEGESGASLRAAGFRVVGERPSRGGWNTPSRPRESRTCPNCGHVLSSGDVARTLWEVTRSA